MHHILQEQQLSKLDYFAGILVRCYHVLPVSALYPTIVLQVQQLNKVDLVQQLSKLDSFAGVLARCHHLLPVQQLSKLDQVQQLSKLDQVQQLSKLDTFATMLCRYANFIRPFIPAWLKTIHAPITSLEQ